MLQAGQGQIVTSPNNGEINKYRNVTDDSPLDSTGIDEENVSDKLNSKSNLFLSSQAMQRVEKLASSRYVNAVVVNALLASLVGVMVPTIPPAALLMSWLLGVTFWGCLGVSGWLTGAVVIAKTLSDRDEAVWTPLVMGAVVAVLSKVIPRYEETLKLGYAANLASLFSLPIQNWASEKAETLTQRREGVPVEVSSLSPIPTRKWGLFEPHSEPVGEGGVRGSESRTLSPENMRLVDSSIRMLASVVATHFYLGLNKYLGVIGSKGSGLLSSLVGILSAVDIPGLTEAHRGALRSLLTLTSALFLNEVANGKGELFSDDYGGDDGGDEIGGGDEDGEDGDDSESEREYDDEDASMDVNVDEDEVEEVEDSED